MNASHTSDPNESIDTTLCILGASGDLTSRLLLPALGQLLMEDPHRRVRLVGAGMDDWDDEKWRDTVRKSFASAKAEGDTVEGVREHTTYRRTDITDSDDFAGLLKECQGRVALYFAVPPAIAAKGCRALEKVDLPEGLILALEKPFGSDEKSAHALNEQLTTLVPEEQVYRIDHFMGRSTVLNVLGLRFANRVFEPVWSNEHIESVAIRYDETLGLEGRAGYYDNAGALIDMIQSHLLQVLAVVAMDPPATLDAVDFRDAKGAALRATEVWDEDAAAHSRRARYTAGSIDGRDLPNYVDEPGVDPSHDTETLAEVTFAVETSRWAGVPFTLRSGKALGEKVSEIVMRFKDVSHLPGGFEGSTEPSVLRLSLGPDRRSLELNLNGPGDPFHLDRASLEAEFGEGERRAYSEVLEGILDGDPTLSVRGDTAEHCWRIVQPVLDAWRSGAVPLEEYPAGSSGPEGWPSLDNGAAVEKHVTES
jgi:glucose-6-phosphate 1-dehydrogenase